jgi:hypothetical protein
MNYANLQYSRLLREKWIYYVPNYREWYIQTVWENIFKITTVVCREKDFQTTVRYAMAQLAAATASL